MLSFKEFIQEKRVAKKRVLSDFQRHFRKLEKAKSDTERLEINVELMLLIKLMSHKEVARAIRSL
ncbi:MAG: hypothetical protein V7745_00610 [Pseudomonadales bacterium]